MPSSSNAPFDDIKNLIASIPSPSADVAVRVREKLDGASHGLRPLGNLGTSIAWLARWQGQGTPKIQKPLIAVFVGAHSVARKITGADPAVLGAQRLENLSNGKAAIRGITSAQGAAFKVYNMGIEQPAADMSEQASLSERECAQAIAFGMEVVSEGADIIAIGSAGVGTVTAAAGIARGLYGGAAEYWVGGSDEGAALRTALVKEAAHLHRNILDNPLEVLRCFGGRDIAGMVGAILAARHQKIPVLLDGFAVCSAAAILHALNPRALDHCIAPHITIEPAHGALLDRIEKKPLLELGLGIGDGSGAALAIGLLKAAAQGNADL